jgi:hypothetical protein
MTKVRIGVACFVAALAAAITVAVRHMRQKEISVKLGEAFWLGMGDTAHIEGEELSLTFKDVVNDSRCPPNVHCIWAGEVQLILDVGKKEHRDGLLFKVGPAGDVAQFDDYVIVISSVEPPRPEQEILDKSDYRIELRVKR